ncbi:MAG TPA: hypothetical protein VMD74_00530 [Candidatus Methylomirabilis sp.]|nr:hypothetical protein [Candidatus Methylomirabilis sp.]
MMIFSGTWPIKPSSAGKGMKKVKKLDPSKFVPADLKPNVRTNTDPKKVREFGKLIRTAANKRCEEREGIK